MFQTIFVEDNICISSTSKDHVEALYKAINQKYINKVIPNEGIGIRVKELRKIYGKELVNGDCAVHLEFILITFKLFKDEILEAVITKQDENGIYLTHTVVGTIFVSTLFPGTEMKYFFAKNSSEKLVYWCWKYKNNNFYFKNGQEVRCKISNVTYQPFTIEARMNDNGLGPKEWW